MLDGIIGKLRLIRGRLRDFFAPVGGEASVASVDIDHSVEFACFSDNELSVRAKSDATGDRAKAGEAAVAVNFAIRTLSNLGRTQAARGLASSLLGGTALVTKMLTGQDNAPFR